MGCCCMVGNSLCELQSAPLHNEVCQAAAACPSTSSVSSSPGSLRAGLHCCSSALNPGDACSKGVASPCCAALQVPYDEILDVKVYDSDTLGGDDVRECTGCSLLLSMAWLHHSSRHG